ncbi:MAG: alginate export family protein [Pseudomonadota bacterium]
MRHSVSLLAILTGLGMASPALAGPLDPIEVSEGVTLDPLLDARFRIETADQPTFPDNASSVTIRARAGAELKVDGFSLLAEGEFTGALDDSYNDTIPSNGIEPFPVIADPETAELNRLHIGYKKDGFGLTVGRQRIIHDDARFLGNVVWRQNEQTFDAVRAQAEFGPVEIDASYANSQRTIFGSDSPNEEFEGDLFLARGALNLDKVKLVAYTYQIDYDTRVAFSSGTFGLTASGSIPAGPVTIGLKASYATQSDIGSNPVTYDADYLLAEGSLKVAGFTLRGQYEELGSDDGIAAFQTPLATAHKFNGFADLFLVTPATGLRDTNFRVVKNFKVPGLPGGITALVTYHEFDSDFGGIDYGTEFDAVVRFKVGPVGLLAKYGNYQADSFAVDTERFTLQAGISF